MRKHIIAIFSVITLFSLAACSSPTDSPPVDNPVGNDASIVGSKGFDNLEEASEKWMQLISQNKVSEACEYVSPAGVATFGGDCEQGLAYILQNEDFTRHVVDFPSEDGWKLVDVHLDEEKARQESSVGIQSVSEPTNDASYDYYVAYANKWDDGLRFTVIWDEDLGWQISKTF